MDKDCVWKDKDGKEYTLADISDGYLFNILSFIANGGGYVDFLDVDKIKKLYKESKIRKIKHSFTLEQLLNAFYEKLNLYCQQFDFRY